MKRREIIDLLMSRGHSGMRAVEIARKWVEAIQTTGFSRADALIARLHDEEAKP